MFFLMESWYQNVLHVVHKLDMKWDFAYCWKNFTPCPCKSMATRFQVSSKWPISSLVNSPILVKRSSFIFPPIRMNLQVSNNLSVVFMSSRRTSELPVIKETSIRRKKGKQNWKWHKPVCLLVFEIKDRKRQRMRMRGYHLTRIRYRFHLDHAQQDPWQEDTRLAWVDKYSVSR